MSAGPVNPNPYATPQFGGAPGASPELMSKASSAFTMGIIGIVLGLPCCCPLIGLVLGFLSMNNAGSVLAMAPAGSEAHSKASTAKMIGIAAIVVSGIGMVIGVILFVLQVVAGALMQN